MRTIAPRAPNDHHEAIALVAPYNDTIELSSRSPFPSPLLKIIHANCGSMLPDVVRDRNDPQVIWHYLLAINQPSRYLINVLQEYHERHARLSIYRVHIAYDVIDIAPAYTRDDVIDVFSKLFHLRHRRSADDMHVDEGTLYSVKTRNRKTRPYRNTILYTNRNSKLTGECDAIHFELRLERKRSVERVIDEPKDLLTLKPAQIFAKEIAIKDIRPILATIIRRSIKAISPHPLIDIERRIRATVKWTGVDHASVFAGPFKYQFERVKHWDCIDVERTLNWASVDVMCEDDLRDLHCLLPPRRKRCRERLILRERL